MKLMTGKQLVQDKMNEVKSVQNIAKIARFHQSKTTATMKWLDFVLKRFDDEKLAISAHCWTSIHPWVDSLNPVTIQLNMGVTASSMKEGIVPQMLKVLMDAGFDSKKSHDYVTEWCGRRTFYFTREATDKHHQIKIEFAADVNDKDAAATCRKIQTGVEMQEVPVYKLECDSPTAADMEAATA